MLPGAQLFAWPTTDRLESNTRDREDNLAQQLELASNNLLKLRKKNRKIQNHPWTRTQDKNSCGGDMTEFQCIFNTVLPALNESFVNGIVLCVLTTTTTRHTSNLWLRCNHTGRILHIDLRLELNIRLGLWMRIWLHRNCRWFLQFEKKNRFFFSSNEYQYAKTLTKKNTNFYASNPKANYFSSKFTYSGMEWSKRMFDCTMRYDFEQEISMNVKSSIFSKEFIFRTPFYASRDSMLTIVGL